MKRLIFTMIAISLVIASCKKPGCTDYMANNYNQYATTDDGSCEYDTIPNLIEGRIEEDLTLTSDKIWNLKGRVSVVNGATLTIEPGTIIKGQPGTGANSTCLIISRGSKIDAQGTASMPIIFTSHVDDIQLGEYCGTSLDNTISGLWGGVIILGYAPISAPGNISSYQIEGIPASDMSGLYGGNTFDDDSGIMTYVSIRHGGANIGEGNEINGLTLGGVGNGTVINNIEIVANQDDGIEFFGGKVNVENLLVWNVGDDCIDVDQAWEGTLSNSLIIPRETGSANGTENVIEADGGEGILQLPFTILNCNVISTATTNAHFRDEAAGLVTYYGDIEFEHDPDTWVMTDTVEQPIDQTLFNWTYYFNQ